MNLKHIALLVLAIGLVASACSTEVLTLSVGTCFDDPASFEDVTDVPQIDCASPHENEVFINVDLTDTTYPGDEIVQSSAFDICEGAFESFVGIAYFDSIYDVGWLNPTSESWEAGDREIICFIYAVDLTKITGSVQGVAK